MNIKQMKHAISTFRSADVSIIKDDAMRTKAQKLQAKQKGFTLLELLVVITLLASLATAALVAYDGIGENATDTAAANSLISAESALRNYRAVENAYPNQWDNMATLKGVDIVDASGAGISTTTGELLAAETTQFFGQWVALQANPNGVLAGVAEALAEVGIEDFQTIDASGAIQTNAVPNLAFNESGGENASELQLWDEDNEQLAITWDEGAIAGTDVALSIVPAGGVAGTCTAGTIDISTPFDVTATAPVDSSALNLINDAIADDSCTLVIALGYGKDVPGTTIDSRVAIAQVPTVGTTNVNSATSYARAIALFQVGEDTNGDTNIDSTEIFPRARLIGVVDPEGRAIDTVLAAANTNN